MDVKEEGESYILVRIYGFHNIYVSEFKISFVRKHIINCCVRFMDILKAYYSLRTVK